MRRALTLSLVVSVVGFGTALAADEAAKDKERPQVEVAFVLDTTGSMSGLIHAAKQKIWSIANTMVTSKPTPKIKIGLVGYRDRGDAYVTKMTSLTDDLDAVYNTLMKFEANGGGDTPESVNQALHEAVTTMPWSTNDKTYRVIFLVGDCPPHMDYKNDVKYPKTCELAAKRAIVINTIQCGNHGATTPIWTDIAKRAEGRFFRVGQSGDAILASTPFDKQLATLARQLDETRIVVGTKEEREREVRRQAIAESITKTAAPSAAAQRAEFNATTAARDNLGGDNDLVNVVTEGKMKLDDLDAKQLPEPLQKLSKEELQQKVEAAAKRRATIQARIKELSAKRQAYIKKNNDDAKRKDSLENKVYRAVQDQAKKRGIEYKNAEANY
jgi:hypothetical protein